MASSTSLRMKPLWCSPSSTVRGISRRKSKSGERPMAELSPVGLLRMQALVEDFLQSLRHERGHAEHTQRPYAALLGKFVAWAGLQRLSDWKSVELRHLMSFLQHECQRALANQPKDSPRRLSSESLYLEIAALRALYRFAENENLLPANLAENLSLPRRWKRFPTALTSREID